MNVLRSKFILLTSTALLIAVGATHALAQPAEINGGMKPVSATDIPVPPPSTAEAAQMSADEPTTAVTPPATDSTAPASDVTAPVPAATPPNLLEAPVPATESAGPAVITTGQPAEVTAQEGLTPLAGETEALPDTTVPASKGALVPAPVAPQMNQPDVFFDAETLIPEGEMSTKAAGPRKVDPTTSSASRLVIVKTNATGDSTDGKLVAAGRAMKLGRYDAALEMYNDLYEKNSSDQRILMGRAVALQHLGQYDEAMQNYQQLVDKNPDNLEAKINMLGLLGSKYPAVALRELLDLHETQPNNIGVVAQVAVTEAQLGNLDEAIKYLGIAASMEPNNASHYFNMGVIADRAGKMTEAVLYYEKALEVDAVYGRSKSVPRDAIYERLAVIR